MQLQGTRLRVTISTWDVSYATRDSLPPPSSTPPGGIVTLAKEEDVDALAALHIDFVVNSPWPGTVTPAEATDVLSRTVAAGHTWLYRTEEGVVGYTILGRVTPRTIALRNVYVAPQHRRKGIAEAMVRALTRYCLGVRPSGVEGVPDVHPSGGLKEQMNLFVMDPGAERVYRRAGFLFPDREDGGEGGGRDPCTGRKAWYHAVWRGVEVEPSPSR